MSNPARSTLALLMLPAILAASLFVSPGRTLGQNPPVDLFAETVFPLQTDFIHQDRHGFIWLAFSGEVVVFDGVDRLTFVHSPFDTTSISQGNYFAMATESDDSIWLGTSASGVNRMTGYGGRVERWGTATDHPDALTSGEAISILVDNEDRVWVGTTRGLNRFDKKTRSFVQYTHDPSDPRSLPGDFIGSIAQDSSGVLWIGTSRGLAKMDVDSGTFEGFPFRYLPDPRFGGQYESADQVHEHVRDIYVDKVGRMWIVLSPGSAGPIAEPQAPFGVLVRFDESDRSFRAFELLDAGSRVGVASIIQDLQGQYWAATERGLAAFNPTTGAFTQASFVGVPDEVSHHIVVTKIEVDREGALWLRALGSVLRILPRRPGIKTYSTVGGGGRSRSAENYLARLAGKYGWVDAVILSRDRKTLWFSAGNEELKPPNGLVRRDVATGRETRYRHDPDDPTSLSNDYVQDIAERSDGKIWVAGPGGLNLLDPNTGVFEHFYIDGDRVTSKPGPNYAVNGELPLETNRIVAIYPVSDTRLWLATFGQGAVLVDIDTGSKQSFYYETPYTEWRRRANDVVVSKDGFVWMVFTKAVARVNPTTGAYNLYTYDPADPASLAISDGTSVYEDSKGRIWVGGFGGGLNLFQPETSSWTHYGREHGLPSNDVTCVVDDDLGNIWVSTFSGISRFNPEKETFENFWPVDGLQGSRYASEACRRAPSGELLFPGERGFTIIQPDSLSRSLVLPGIALTSVRVSGTQLRPGLDPRLPRALSQTAAIQVDYDENNVEFDYAGIDFGQTGTREYQYRLDPLEHDWVDARQRTSASYTNLDPGKYAFQARLSVAGRMSPAPAVIGFVIAPPWWGTWWARILFGFAFVATLFGAYSYRIRRLKADAIRLEAEVFNRTRDLEDEKRKTEEQAHRLLELDETKNRFFANISHEFRTPLTLIIGPLQDAIEGSLIDDPVALNRTHGVMLANARRVLRLINQLLDLSKVEAGKLEVEATHGDLVAFLRSLQTSFAPSADRRQIDLSFRTAAESLSSRFDHDKIEKVVSNLLSNALKFTPAGGKVELSLDSRPGDEPDSANVTINVRDSGRGIAEEDLERIFDRFHQVDDSATREFEGTGIGLSLVRELTELMHGTVSVESQVGFGTTFRIEIPVPLADPATIQSTGFDEPEGSSIDRADASIFDTGDVVRDLDLEGAATGKAVILVIEDNAEVREYVRSKLSTQYQVIEAQNGEEGLTRAKECQPDLILSDVMMPVMDGLEMTRRLREIPGLRFTPVVMLTAKTDERETVEGIEAGADDYITKPFGPAELEARVASLIGRRREMREQFSDEVVVKGADIVVTSDDARFIQRVIEIVDARLDDAGFGADWLADDVGLSRRQLERKLDEVLSESPSALIRRMRLERASKLLRAKAGTVAEIAYSVGFTNAAYFTRAFKKAYGESPSEHGRD